MKEVKNTILQEESFQMNLHLHWKQLLLHLQLLYDRAFRCAYCYDFYFSCFHTQVTVNYNTCTKQFHLQTPHRRHMTKSIARGHKKGLVDQCFGDEETSFYIRKKSESIIRSEIKKMCSQEVNSILQGPVKDIASFKWESVLAELNANAPTLLSVLSAAVGKLSETSSTTIGVCCGIILKSRFNKMSLVQKMVAVILQAGHSSKQVLYLINCSSN